MVPQTRQARPRRGDCPGQLAKCGCLTRCTDPSMYRRAAWRRCAHGGCAMVIGLRVAFMAGHGDRDVERASINLEPEALAIHDHVAGWGRDGSAAVTGAGQADAGQVADGVRNRDGHLACTWRTMTCEPGKGLGPLSRGRWQGLGHRLGRQCPGQQQRAIHGLGGGGSTAAAMVRVPWSTRPVSSTRSTVPSSCTTRVQRGGIDLRPLTRPRRGHRAERPVGLAGQRSAGAGRADGMPARGQPSRQPVEGPLGRHHRPVPGLAGFGQDLLDPAA